MTYEISNWNPMHFAIYHGKVQIVQHILQRTVNPLLTMRLPPIDDATEYVLPYLIRKSVRKSSFNSENDEAASTDFAD